MLPNSFTSDGKSSTKLVTFFPILDAVSSAFSPKSSKAFPIFVPISSDVFTFCSILSNFISSKFNSSILLFVEKLDEEDDELKTEFVKLLNFFIPSLSNVMFIFSTPLICLTLLFNYLFLLKIDLI